MAEQTASLAGHVEGGVDGFLHVAARFSQDLTHLAGHFARILFLALQQQFAGAIQNLGALGRRRQPPGLPGFGRGFHGGIDVFRA